MNMLNVSHFNKSPGSITRVRKLLMLVQDGCMWIGKRIPINPMLIWRITRLPYQELNPAEDFVGKDHEKAIAENMKKNFGLTKGK